MINPTRMINNNFLSQSDSRDILTAISGFPDLTQKFQNLPSRFKDLVGDVQLPNDSGEGLVNALKLGTAVLASDGSYYEDINKGMHTYLLESTELGCNKLCGSATSPQSDHMSSAPTEHYGAIAVITCLIVLLYHHNEDGLGWPVVNLYIDNEEIVNRGNKRYPKFRNVRQYLVHDYDLWLTTSDLLSSMNLQVNFEWVRGHQSLDANNENIQAILLNTEVDRMVTEQYKKHEIPPHRGAFHSGIVCFHQQGFHVQKIQNAKSARESDANLLEYYTSHGLRTSNLEKVDWKNLEFFLKRCHPN
jgi:hypothetical protein